MHKKISLDPRNLCHNILKITLPIHALLLFSLFLMPTRLVFEYVLIWAFIWICVSGLGLAIGYHRLLCHKAFQCKRWKRNLLALCGCMAGQGSPVFWVATHRGLHHPFADHKKDPHSPVHGRFHSFIGWQFNFSDKDFSIRYAVDLLRDPFLKFISLHYYKIYWTPILITALIDLEFCLLALIPALVLSIHQENFVNWISHEKNFGYRNFELNDQSNNHKILSFFSWGQALHNNHHKYPSRFNFAIKPGEYDPSVTLIKLLNLQDNPINYSKIEETL